jgi:hypothetical protein
LDEKEDSVFEDDGRFLRYPPKVVLVQFYEWVDRDDKLVQEPCAWHIDSMDKCGVYPIRAWKRAWFLDQRRLNPQLRVKRFQVPMAPACSMIAHSAQGRTLASAIIDSQIGRGVSAIASYVAMTRARIRLDLLIYRNSEREQKVSQKDRHCCSRYCVGRTSIGKLWKTSVLQKERAVVRA